VTRPLVLVAGMLVAALAFAGTTPAADLAAYRGLSTWVDIYDDAVLSNPELAVSEMRGLGVGVVFLETGNSSQAADVVEPALVGRFVEAAHAEGLRVVAWYLPTLVRPARDLRRALAAIDFATPAGERFDSFALDIESSAIKLVPRRTARVLTLAERLRATVGPDYPLGAIIPAPRGMELRPGYWPAFPYAQLAGSFDVFLPMVYFSYRTHNLTQASDYVARSIGIIREQTGNREIAIQAIGGIAARSRLGQVRGFVAAACGAGAVGIGLYDFATTRPRQWEELGRFTSCASAASEGSASGASAASSS
jgi:hypothetical protein